MRLPRLRFRIGWLLALVALVALALAARTQLQKRSVALRALAQGYADRASEPPLPLDPPADWQALIWQLEHDQRRSQRAARIKYYQALADKYHWAADHPSLPVFGDPPAPE